MDENLKQILFKLNEMQADVKELKEMRADVNDLKGMRSDVNELKQMRVDLNVLKEMRSDLNDLKGMRTDINELKEGIKRLEDGQAKLQKNLIDSLGAYTKKIIEHVEDKTETLNKRVFNVESEIERLSRQ